MKILLIKNKPDFVRSCAMIKFSSSLCVCYHSIKMIRRYYRDNTVLLFTVLLLYYHCIITILSLYYPKGDEA